MAVLFHRWLLVLVTCLLAGTANAQFQQVELGVNGLTCSMCTRSVEMRLRRLPFVEEVTMDLAHTNGVVTMKPNKKADLEAIAKAVKEAGFSVRYLKAAVPFHETSATTGGCYALKNATLSFADAPKQPLDGVVTVQFLGEDFLPKTDYKKWAPKLKNGCGRANGSVYYVTLAQNP